MATPIICRSFILHGHYIQNGDALFIWWCLNFSQISGFSRGCSTSVLLFHLALLLGFAKFNWWNNDWFSLSCVFVISKASNTSIVVSSMTIAVFYLNFPTVYCRSRLHRLFAIDFMYFCTPLLSAPPLTPLPYPTGFKPLCMMPEDFFCDWCPHCPYWVQEMWRSEGVRTKYHLFNCQAIFLQFATTIHGTVWTRQSLYYGWVVQ